MALPVAPAKKPKDVIVLDWAGLTVRIVWTLLRLGIKVRPDVLRYARIHALHHLDAGMPATTAEDLAEHLTEEFVARARGQAPSDPWAKDWDGPLSPRWRGAVLSALDENAELVFRKHYGDNRSLTHLENTLGADRITLEGAQAGLREVVRGIGVADGVPMEQWPASRLDRTLRRLAAWAPGPCPPLQDVREGFHRDHVVGCPRCERLVRLLQSEILTLDDLLPPSVGARPTSTTRVLAVQLHPDGRRYGRALMAELPARAFPVGDDLLLIEPDQLDAVHEVLVLAAEVGAPEAKDLRGVLLSGPGTWSELGLLGPLPESAARKVRQRDWGTIEGLGTLPGELPKPPSARGAWVMVLACVLAALVLLQLVALSPSASGPGDLVVDFTPGRGGLWAAFDVPEATWVTVISERGGTLEILLESRSAADKAELAVGDGSYRLHAPGDGVLLVAHDAPLDELYQHMAEASAEPEPLAALARALERRLQVRWSER